VFRWVVLERGWNDSDGGRKEGKGKMLGRRRWGGAPDGEKGAYALFNRETKGGAGRREMGGGPVKV